MTHAVDWERRHLAAERENEELREKLEGATAMVERLEREVETADKQLELILLDVHATLEIEGEHDTPADYVHAAMDKVCTMAGQIAGLEAVARARGERIRQLQHHLMAVRTAGDAQAPAGGTVTRKGADLP